MKMRTVGPILILCCAMLIAGCRKDDAPPKDTTPDRFLPGEEEDPTSFKALATELYQLAKISYLWNDNLPDEKAFNIEQYVNRYERNNKLQEALKTIKGCSPEDMDVWSDLWTGQSSISSYYRLEANDRLYAPLYGFSIKRLSGGKYYVASVEVDSPAERAQLRRGMEIISVDGKTIKGLPMSEAKGKFNMGGDITLRRSNEQEYHIIPEYYEHDPIFSLGFEAGIVFMVYGNFDDDPDRLEDLDATFETIEDLNAKKIVIDLRYNSGGSNTAAERLLSHLAGAQYGGDVAYLLKTNSTLEALSKWKEGEPVSEIQSFLEKRTAPDGEGSLYDYFRPIWLPRRFKKLNNISFDKICFIVSKETNSASLLVINALKPFFKSNLFIVGQDTGTKGVMTVDLSLLPYEKKDKGVFDLSLVVAYFQNKDGQGIDPRRGIAVDTNVVDDVTHDFDSNDEACRRAALSFLKP